MNKKSKKPLFLLLFIPIIAAIALLWGFSRNGAVIRVEIADGETVYEEEKDIALFNRIVEEAIEIDAPVRPISEYKKLGVKLIRFFGEDEYIFFFSGVPSDCLLKNESGKLFKIETSDATELMLMKGFEAVSRGYQLPTVSLRVDGRDVSLEKAQNVTWSFHLAESNFSTRTHAPEEELSFTVGSDYVPALSFSVKPDQTAVTVTGDSLTLFDGTAEEFASFTCSRDCELKVTVRAKWNEHEGVEYYGETQVDFTLIYDAPARFLISADTAVQGDLVTVLAENCRGEKVRVSSELIESGSDPLIDYASEKVALIPISLDTEPGDYTVRISAGEAEEVFTVKVEDKSFSTVDLKGVNAEDMKLAKADLETLLDSLVTDTDGQQLWNGEFIAPLEGDNVWISASFGSNIRVDSEKTAMRKENLDYVGEIGTYVRAANDGVVIFAGEAPFTGNTVVIDHGAGIRTVYGNLQSITVTKDMKVFKAQNVGTLGNTGFTAGRCLYFGARVFGVPVNPSTVFIGKDPDFFDLKLTGR